MSLMAPGLYLQRTVAEQRAEPSRIATAGAHVEGGSTVDYVLRDAEGTVYVVQVESPERTRPADVASWLSAVTGVVKPTEDRPDTDEDALEQAEIARALQESQLRAIALQDQD